MNEDFTLEGMMNAFLSYKMESMFTCMPAIVVGVRELDKQKIDVQPVINRLDSDGYSIEYPTILSVPIIFPSSSTSSFTFPINQGDNVLLVFSQKGMDVFKSGDGTPNDPSDARSFDKRDAIAIPCVWPFEKAINQQSRRTLPHNVNDAVISHNLGTAVECEVRLKQDGSVMITGSQLILEGDTFISGSLSTDGNVVVGTGATGSFTTATGNIVTVTDGIITNIF